MFPFYSGTDKQSYVHLVHVNKLMSQTVQQQKNRRCLSKEADVHDYTVKHAEINQHKKTVARVQGRLNYLCV